MSCWLLPLKPWPLATPWMLRLEWGPLGAPLPVVVLVLVDVLVLLAVRVVLVALAMAEAPRANNPLGVSLWAKARLPTAALPTTTAAATSSTSCFVTRRRIILPFL